MKRKTTDYLSKVARDTQQMLEKGMPKTNPVKEKPRKVETKDTDMQKPRQSPAS